MWHCLYRMVMYCMYCMAWYVLYYCTAAAVGAAKVFSSTQTRSGQSDPAISRYRALRELLPNCWRVVAAMLRGHRSSPSILNASLNTWYT